VGAGQELVSGHSLMTVALPPVTSDMLTSNVHTGELTTRGTELRRPNATLSLSAHRSRCSSR